MSDMEGFGMTRYSYTKEQMEKTFNSLDANGWRLIKAFHDVWEDPDVFGNAPRHYAPIILTWMERLKALMILHGRSFDAVWRYWLTQEDTFDKVETVNEKA